MTSKALMFRLLAQILIQFMVPLQTSNHHLLLQKTFLIIDNIRKQNINILQSLFSHTLSLFRLLSKPFFSRISNIRKLILYFLGMVQNVDFFSFFKELDLLQVVNQLFFFGKIQLQKFESIFVQFFVIVQEQICKNRIVVRISQFLVIQILFIANIL